MFGQAILKASSVFLIFAFTLIADGSWWPSPVLASDVATIHGNAWSGDRGCTAVPIPSSSTPSAPFETATVLVTVWNDRNENGVRDRGEEIVRPSQITAWLRGDRGEQGAIPRALLDPKDTNPIPLQIGFRYLLQFNPPTGVPANLEGWGYVDLTAARASTVVEVEIGLRPIRYGPDGKVLTEYDLPNGRFFTHANGFGGVGYLGFPVTNDDGIPFWDTWQNLGLQTVGYPISGRFIWKGFTTQAFQKAVFQWQPGEGMFFVNVFDELHQAGQDEWLRANRSTPLQLDASFDEGKSWDEIVQGRLALLDANPAIKAQYLASPDPLLVYGLPTSRVEDFGDVLVIRTQRAVFQQWKVDVPWARAGQVTIANGGDIAKELGLFPAEALAPVPPPHE